MPLWVSYIGFLGRLNESATTRITGAKGEEVLLALPQRGGICTARVVWVIELHPIIFPKADRADSKRTGRFFVERLESTAGTSVFHRFRKVAMPCAVWCGSTFALHPRPLLPTSLVPRASWGEGEPEGKWERFGSVSGIRSCGRSISVFSNESVHKPCTAHDI